ncbi:hypothetical protein [Yoonia litorea]|uniref:hypothetical protein n=1 Tax=Yoonia litorea TaxID=1123755 RepID=UPI001F6156E7|nr:hypothetical protein [Yoonia litorea]
MLRFVLLIALIVGATWASHTIRDALNLEIMPRNEQSVHTAVMFGTVAYVVLLAIPFVPGAEIGIALLGSFGASIAPLVYAATVVAMMLAYCVGLLLPASILARMLAFLRMDRAAELLDRVCALPREERLSVLLESAPPSLVRLALRRRYLALALAVNVPGNAVIGGGGGIMMVAGLSGIFAPLPTLIAVMIGVSPVPLAIMLFGARF